MQKPDKVIPPSYAELVTALLESYMGREMHIILLAFPSDACDEVQFLTSLPPDIMEAVMIEISRQIEEGVAGKRDVRSTER